MYGWEAFFIGVAVWTVAAVTVQTVHVAVRSRRRCADARAFLERERIASAARLSENNEAPKAAVAADPPSYTPFDLSAHIADITPPTPEQIEALEATLPQVSVTLGGVWTDYFVAETGAAVPPDPEIDLADIVDLRCEFTRDSIDVTTYGDLADGRGYQYVTGMRRETFYLRTRTLSHDWAAAGYVRLHGRRMVVERYDIQAPFDGPVEAELTLRPAGGDAVSDAWWPALQAQMASSRMEQMAQAGLSATEAMQNIGATMQQLGLSTVGASPAGIVLFATDASIAVGTLVSVDGAGRARPASSANPSPVIGIALESGDGWVNVQMQGPATAQRVSTRLRAAAERLRVKRQPEPEPTLRPVGGRRFTLEDE
jgi:hypothetical protein